MTKTKSKNLCSKCNLYVLLRSLLPNPMNSPLLIPFIGDNVMAQREILKLHKKEYRTVGTQTSLV